LISENPKLFPIVHNDLKIRKCVISKQNILFYREVHKNIEIVRLFDSRQDPKKLNF
jgi:plasmid stabilization system protein ParE